MIKVNEMNDEEKTYKKLLDDLKNLPKVDAPKNFETELLRKINSSGYEKKESFWDKLLTPGKLAPAAIAIASAAIIFFVVDINSEVMEDPLNIAPRLREDLVVVQSIDEIPVPPQKENKRVKKETSTREEEMIETKEFETYSQPTEAVENQSDNKPLGLEKSIADELTADKSNSDSFRIETGNLSGGAAPAPITTSSSEISKDNLNFMQRNLSSEEKKEVQELKMKVQSEKSAKTDEKERKSR
ncbi:MAG: hypothetical protein IH620_03055 [Ignavibacterium sp.]|nr:hypothetical protein [Ignavibacterium sp.]